MISIHRQNLAIITGGRCDCLLNAKFSDITAGFQEYIYGFQRIPNARETNHIFANIVKPLFTNNYYQSRDLLALFIILWLTCV